MVWQSKKSFVRRFVPVLLAVLVFMTSMPGQVVYASGGGTNAQQEEQVGTSLYDVTTALTAFASNVVGANTNDKHSDDSAVPAGGGGAPVGSTVGSKDHQIWEMSNNAPTAVSDTAASGANAGYVQIGDTGAIVGYGDKTKGFVSYLSANETRSLTTSTYAAYLNIGDDGRTFAYTRYGRLLNDLGIDETGNPSGSSASRWGGRFIQFCYVASSFIPTIFDLSMDLLRTLNPFQFFIDSDPVANVLNGTGATEDIMDPFTGTAGGGDGLPTGSETAPNFLSAHTFSNLLKPVRQFCTQAYMMLRGMGMFIILPFTLVLLIASFLLFRNGSKFPKVVLWLERALFIVAGIPLLGVMYTSMLDEVGKITLQSAPSARVVLATFADFENWVKTSRLYPPESGEVNLVSEKISDNEAQGQANAESWRTVRSTIYQVNRSTGLYPEVDSSSNLGWHSLSGSGMEVETTAGMWDTTTGEWSSDIVADDSGIRKNLFNEMNSVLDTYASGSFYTASAWESNINSALSANYRSDLGSTASTDPASSNKKTINQMYFDTDEVDDWMDRSADDNAYIFGDEKSMTDAAGAPTGPEEAAWSQCKWNIFNNGTNMGIAGPTASLSIDNDMDLTFKSERGTDNVSLGTATSPSNGFIPENNGGLSTVSMYNYLSTAFNPTNVAVYSAANTTSEYTRLQHYSVNSAGSGATGHLFLVNAGVVLGVFVILGFCYCLGMLVDIVKQGFHMIMQVPAAMLGFVRSIGQVVIYVVGMLAELFGTIFLYQVVMELVVLLASVVEGPVLDSVGNVQAAGVAGGIFGMISHALPFVSLYNSRFLFGAALFVINIALVYSGVVAVQLSRVALTAWSYLWLKAFRLMTCPAMLPVFDAWVAKRKSIYVWDEVADGLEKIPGTIGGLLGSGETVPVERGVNRS